MRSDTYSIIIPAYNESQRLPASLDKILAYIAQKNWTAEVVVVNDGSRDNTADVVRKYMLTHPAVRLVENPGNRGKGYSVRHGMMEGRGDVLLLTDADLSSPIYEAEKLFAAIDAGADIAIGSRWLARETQTQRQPFYRQLSGRVYNLMLRGVLGLKFADTQCGFKAFTRKAAEAILPPQKIERWGFDPEILYLANNFGFKTVEVPVEWANDERSKINPLTDGFKMLWELMRVRWYAASGAYAAAPVARTADSSLRSE
jgi:dolichyl-phosphate beta-glucosyltransferase